MGDKVVNVKVFRDALGGIGRCREFAHSGLKLTTANGQTYRLDYGPEGVHLSPWFTRDGHQEQQTGANYALDSAVSLTDWQNKMTQITTSRGKYNPLTNNCHKAQEDTRSSFQQEQIQNQREIVQQEQLTQEEIKNEAEKEAAEAVRQVQNAQTEYERFNAEKDLHL
jgi:hypothetical protein